MKHDSSARQALFERLDWTRYRTWGGLAESFSMSVEGFRNICMGKTTPSWRTRIRIYMLTGITPLDWGPPINRDCKLAAQPLPKLPRHRCSEFSPACTGSHYPRDGVSIVTEGSDDDSRAN